MEVRREPDLEVLVRVRWAAMLLLPLVGLALLLAVPSLDVRWEHQPAHFWIVLVPAAISAGLGLATGEAATRRGDARTFLVSMALLSSAGFLGMHALATPGVLVEGPNTGFAVATPIGLILASLFAAWSVHDRVERLPSRGGPQQVVRAVVLLLLVGWGAASLGGVEALRAAPSPQAPWPIRLAAPVAVALYLFAAWRYARVHRERQRTLPLAVAVAYVLLAEAMVTIVFARNWHASWWQWHVLMAVAFAAIFLAARAEYRREGSVAEAFSSLYLDRTLELFDERSSEALGELTRALRRGEPLGPVRERLRADGITGERLTALERSAVELHRVDGLLHTYVGSQLADRLSARPDLAELGGRTAEVSVLFADLVGFTAYSEPRPPEEGMALLNTYWAAIVPTIVDGHGGLIERFAGDGILVVFNALGDQPDHALRAVRAGRFLQAEIERLAAGQPDWPRFRVGINTGPAVLGNVGADQRRTFTVIGDTANTAARFEALAEPGSVLIGAATYALVRDDVATEPLGPVEVKGKAEPQEVYALSTTATRPGRARKN